MIKRVPYKHGNLQCTGYFAPSPYGGKQPTVICVHAWSGLDDFVISKAERIAREYGYNAFAIDMFGDGKNPQSVEEKMSVLKPFLDGRKLTRDRAKAGMDAMITHAGDQIDTDRIAVMGYCFGGMVALEFARSGADIRAAVAFHGLIQPGADVPAATDIKASVLALNGDADPMVPVESVMSFMEEMNGCNADWTLINYGNAAHSFTFPTNYDPENGHAYDPVITERSWRAMVDLFEERLS